MKKQPVTLAIPTPCHENWQQMDAAEQGRFCHSCQKTVLDFTGKTDREVATFFQKNEASTCGRFRPDQLHRPLLVEQPGGFGARLRALGLVVPGLLAGGLAQAQSERPVLMGKIAPRTVVCEPQVKGEVNVQDPKPVLMGDTIVAPVRARILTGTVRDAETGEPLIGCTILLKGTVTGTVSDIDGNYRLPIPGVENPVLVFSYTGYEAMELGVGNDQREVNALMGASQMMLGGAIAIVRTVSFQRDQTLYNLAKHKIKNLISNIRQQGAAKKRATRQKEIEAIDISQNIENQPIEAPVAPMPPVSPALKAKAFPNPFAGTLHLELDYPQAETLLLRLSDMNGRIVFSKNYEAMKGLQTISLETGDAALSAGNLMLEIVGKKGLLFAEMVAASGRN